MIIKDANKAKEVIGVSLTDDVHLKFERAWWIWAKASEYNCNHWINVRKCFDAPLGAEEAKLHISVDTDYCVWLNGVLVGQGQFSDFPEVKTYDVIDVGKYIKQGKNCLAVLAYYQGISTSRYKKGQAGLIFSLSNKNTVLGSSDKSCKARTSLSYKSGPVPLVTKQLGLTIEHDASREDRWLDIDYDDSQWEDGREMCGPVSGFWKSLRERPVKQLEYSDIAAKVLQSGYFLRPETGDTFAETIANDIFIDKTLFPDNAEMEGGSFIAKKPTGNQSGVYIVFDLERELFGHLKFRLSASAGIVLDIAHGEHLADGRVRCKIGDRNFADRYICSEGAQEWEMPVRRIGCCYLEIHISEQKADIEFEYIGIKSAVYPVDLSGKFYSNDLSHNQIFSTAVETSRLCMHEHFEDCPWREQSLYAMDAKTQSLISYYLFGDYQYAKESLSLLGRTIRSDGYLELCSPSEIDFTIPCFSMAWIVSVYNYYLYSGDKDFVNQLLPQMKYMLTTYMQNLGEEGVMLLPTGKNYWNFYEWSPAMNGYNLDSMSHTPNRDSEKIHSCLNLFLLEALDACGRICRFVNDAAATDFEACAGKIRQGLRKYFCLNKGYFIPQENDRSSDSIHSQLIQALGLKLKVFLPQFEDSSRWALAYDKSLSEISLGMHNYYYEALLQKPDLFGGFVLDHIGNRWGKMIESGSSAFWETILGHEDFDGAGSLCHGWSAIPAYIYLGYILGIKPIKPGFKTFLVSPVPGNLLSAVGSVPTPEGLIKIEWKKKHDKYILNISCPPRLEPKISICKDYAQLWEINRL